MSIGGACLRNRTEFHKRLGGERRSSWSASAIPRKRRRARRKRKKRGERSISQPLARENATIRGSHVRQNVHTRGGGRSAPLRVQGHAECGHVCGVKLPGGTRVVFARVRRRVRVVQAHCERRTLVHIFFSYPAYPGSNPRTPRGRKKGEITFFVFLCDLSNFSRIFVEFENGSRSKNV